MDILCVYCFDVLVAELEKRPAMSFPAAQLAKTKPKPLIPNGIVVASEEESRSKDVVSIDTNYPLFVTWNVVSFAGSKKLRGCIGTFEPLPLAQGLKTYALTAAFDDTRFDPITKKEVSKLECCVSLLLDFEECEDALDWTRGIHGIRINFPHPSSPARRRLSATYLPDVCTEQNWTREQCIESLMRKAGYDPTYPRGNGGWRAVKGLKVERYRALKARISYNAYLDVLTELMKLN